MIARTLSSPSLLIAALALSAAACERPVTGRDQGSAVITGVAVTPPYAREGVIVDVAFEVLGAAPARVTLELAGLEHNCEPTVGGDGRLHCRLDGIDRQTYAQGTFAVVVRAEDADGKIAQAAGQVTLDFDCPAFVSLGVSPAIASPGQQATVNIEATEPLGSPPRVTRAGRDWELAAGSGTSFTVTHAITASDPAARTDVVVRLVDRAGNTTDDCGIDGRLPFAVDHAAPSLDGSKILVLRDSPGLPSRLSAESGAFLDDVGIAEVRLLDATGEAVLARLVPREDGSIPLTSLGTQPSGRVLVEAVDMIGRVSPRMTVPEEWRLSVGTGASPGSSLKTAVRFSAPAPGSPFLKNRTLELAPAVAGQDARSAVVHARVGFERTGSLPNAYEDVLWIAGGYDVRGDAIVTFGGTKSAADPEGDLDTYFDRTIILRWSETTGEYVFEYGQPYVRGMTPPARGGHKIAFDGNGCGIMFGGYGYREVDDDFFQIQALADVWQICWSPQGYRWNRINPLSVGEPPIIRRGPIAYDPGFDRYVVVGGYSNAGGLFPHEDVWFLNPGPTTDAWEWMEVTPLPTNFGGHHSHALYYDPDLDAMAAGLGYAFPFSEATTWWLYEGGQWTARGTIPDILRGRQGFGYDYDQARHQLVMWGDNDAPSFDPETWFLTGTATNATAGWSSANLDPPVPRAWPTLIYDPDREVTVAFCGRRFDTRFVPPDVYSIITQPSWPYLSASIDLAAARPKGIERLVLELRATGYGDRDGVGPRIDLEGGVVVKLWDFNASEWVDVQNVDTPPGGAAVDITVDVRLNPERFVGPDGVVPLTLVTRAPATEGAEADLAVDRIDGRLYLRSGVTLP